MAERMTKDRLEVLTYYHNTGGHLLGRDVSELLAETERARDREDALTQANILLAASLTRADREKEALEAEVRRLRGALERCAGT